MRRERELVLSLFPGADLFGRAFEEEGFCVVRGPDILWGGDIRRFHPPSGVFGGVIGGPPCQPFSPAKFKATQADDLIGEFVRVVQETGCTWAVMENVVQARHSPHVPADWIKVVVTDWDCGGFTMRKRAFWFYPMGLGMLANSRRPARRPGKGKGTLLASHYKITRRAWGRSIDKAAYTVLARPWRQHWEDGRRVNYSISVEEAALLQGWPELASEWKAAGMSKRLAIHLLGNGVPRAMGLWVARVVKT